MSFWKKQQERALADAHGSKGGLYLLPGNYLVQIQRCKMIQTREKDDAFVAELLVIKSDNEKLPVGAKPALFVNMDGKYPDLALGNVADFMRPGIVSLARQHGEEAPTVDEVDLSTELAEEITEDSNLLAGVYLNAYAFNKPTKEGKDWTRIEWSVPGDLAEILAAAA